MISVVDACSRSQDQSFEKLRRIYEISSILNDVVEALLKEAEPEDASRFQDTDVSSFNLASFEIFLCLYLILLFCFI